MCMYVSVCVCMCVCVCEHVCEWCVIVKYEYLEQTNNYNTRQITRKTKLEKDYENVPTDGFEPMT